MRLTQLFFSTLKEVPKDAEVISHQLMLRAGMIRKVAAGIYTLMPLGLRVLRKFEGIVREEMNRSGAQEVLMPSVIPAQLWQKSGRWDHYGKELLRFKDRHQNEFCYGPTHEEVITELAGHFIKSYKQLPVNLYQIQTKFRDEIRPRFGLMRGREFMMKDSYSFHRSAEDLQKTYQTMADTYQRIFKRCGLNFKAVKADSGAIGGDYSAEFMVTAQTGEDAIMECSHCDYAANLEAAQGQSQKTDSAKILLFKADKKPVKVWIAQFDEVNEIKLKKVLNAEELYPVSEPIEGLEIRVVEVSLNATTIQQAVYADIRNAQAGDTCSQCQTGTLRQIRGIEVGHIFQLGDKYSKAMQATYVEESGQDTPFLMGCYGIGIGRTVAAAIEQNHDKYGMIWPHSLAPFQATVIATNTSDEAIKACAESVYHTLQTEGVDICFDDREESAGAKFKDADLLGIPLHIIIGKKWKEDNVIELKIRRTGSSETCSLDTLWLRVKDLLAHGA